MSTNHQAKVTSVKKYSWCSSVSSLFYIPNSNNHSKDSGSLVYDIEAQLLVYSPSSGLNSVLSNHSSSSGGKQPLKSYEYSIQNMIQNIYSLPSSIASLIYYSNNSASENSKQLSDNNTATDDSFANVKDFKYQDDNNSYEIV